MGGLLRNFFLRSRSWLMFITLSAGCCCVIIGLYAMSSYPVAESQPAQPVQQSPAVPLPEVSLGDPKAPHKVIMYFALDCDHCRKYEQEILPQIKEQFIDTGQVRFILRDFPMGPAGFLATKVSWARRDPQQYLAIVKKIFDKQEYWNVPDIVKLRKIADVPDYVGKLQEVALEEGLTEPQFNICLKDADLEKAILWEQLQAKGISEVPTFVVDDEPISEILTPEVLTAQLAKKAADTKSQN